MKHKKGTLIPYIILIILLLIFNVPYPVHRELSGVLIQLENPDFCERVTIELVGSYHLNWLTQDEYSGYFRISNDNLTQKKELVFPIEIEADFEDAESDLEFNLQGEKLSKQEMEKVQDNLWHNGGRVLSKRFLRKICIVVPSPEKYDDGRMSWDYGDLSNGKGTIIVMGADTYEEAAAVVAKSYGTSVKL
ncbi:MAG: hypothetical protein MR303_04260 [Emergencia sp.]|nr:hypothetical protein [Emergencia sp.]